MAQFDQKRTEHDGIAIPLVMNETKKLCGDSARLDPDVIRQHSGAYLSLMTLLASVQSTQDRLYAIEVSKPRLYCMNGILQMRPFGF